MADFKFSCPHCGQHLQCDVQFAGRQITCPACQHLIRIPPPPTPAGQAKYAPESGQTWATFNPPPPGLQAAPPTGASGPPDKS